MGNTDGKFDYEKTLKTRPDDSFLNLQAFLHATSKQITQLLYYTPITPHQVILISMLIGITASLLIIQDNMVMVIFGAILLFYKNVLDKVDGSLARAKGMDSRRGRFYDSISDFIVDTAVFFAVGYYLYQKYAAPFIFVICFAAMISSMLQCSFFIYYQVSFIKATGKHTINRLVETITAEDRIREDKWTLFLQGVFQIIYGWQDWLFRKLDLLLKKKASGSKLLSGSSQAKKKFEESWYKDRMFLTTASSLSIGTHMVLIALFAVIRWFEAYLFINLILMNLLLIYLIIFKVYSARRKLTADL